MAQGISFPFRFSPLGHLATSAGSEQIRDQLHLLLSTSLGQRVFRPTYGSELSLFSLRPDDLSLAPIVEQAVVSAVAESGIRVRVSQVTLVPTGDRVRIRVSYTELDDTISVVRQLELEE